MRETAQAGGGSIPTASSLAILPQTLNQYSLLVWKVTYTTAELALAGGQESVFCNGQSFSFNSSGVMFERKPDIVAVIRSGIFYYNSVFCCPASSLKQHAMVLRDKVS